MAAVSVPKPVLQAASGLQQMAKKVQHWYDYLWLWPIIYFVLGFFNILFAWLGMIDFMVPVLLALFGGNKLFCNRYCGRGLLLAKLGGEWKWSRNRATQEFLVAKWFRFGFLCFFMAMFAVYLPIMIFTDLPTALTLAVSLVVSLICGMIAKKHKWLNDFIMAIAMIVAMASSVLWVQLFVK